MVWRKEGSTKSKTHKVKKKGSGRGGNTHQEGEAPEEFHNIVSDAQLTHKQRVFVAEYLVDFNVSRAARVAGVPASSATSMGCQWLDEKRFPLVAAKVKQEIEARKQACEVKAWQVLEELARMAFFNPRNLIDEEGRLIPVHKLPPEVAAVIKKFKHKVERDESTGETTCKVVELEVWDKLDALKSFARHLGLLEGDVHNTNILTINWNDMTRRPDSTGSKDPLKTAIDALRSGREVLGYRGSEVKEQEVEEAEVVEKEQEPKTKAAPDTKTPSDTKRKRSDTKRKR